MKWLALVVCLMSALPTAAAETVDYLHSIKPILRSRCYSCHGALRQKAKLRLDTADLILKGGRSGPAVIPGNSAQSLLLDAVAGRGMRRMPPEAEGPPLTAAQISLLKSWIDQVAKAPTEPI